MKWKYQLVLQFPFSGLTDYDAIIVLEETLIAEVGNKAFVDGHDAGSGEMNIFIHTNDPRRIFEKILSSHASDPMFSQLRAVYRVSNQIITRHFGLRGSKGNSESSKKERPQNRDLHRIADKYGFR